ncbi:unnamed protein product [Urochloa humidicola]
MDKATLLARVVHQLKDLKRKASDTTPPLPIPADANAVTVDCYTGGGGGRGRGYGSPAAYMRASVSCDDRPGLLGDLAGAFRGLKLRPLRADVASPSEAGRGASSCSCCAGRRAARRAPAA